MSNNILFFYKKFYNLWKTPAAPSPQTNSFIMDLTEFFDTGPKHCIE